LQKSKRLFYFSVFWAHNSHKKSQTKKESDIFQKAWIISSDTAKTGQTKENNHPVLANNRTTDPDIHRPGKNEGSQRPMPYPLFLTSSLSRTIL